MLCRICCTTYEELDKSQFEIDIIQTPRYSPRLLEIKPVLKKPKYASVNVYDQDEVFSNKTDNTKKSVQFDASVRIRKRKPPRPSQELKPVESELFQNQRKSSDSSRRYHPLIKAMALKIKRDFSHRK